MDSRRGSLIVLVATFALLGVAGQRASAQVLQLPTFHYFSVDTSVLVPDRGAAYLGGVNYSSSQSTQRGIPGLNGPMFGSRASSRSTGGGGMWVTAQIHDFEALEAQLLGQNGATAGRPGSQRANAGALADANRTPSFAQSIAALRNQAADEDSAKLAEAKAYLQRGQEKLKAGQFGLAKIYFQMAEKRSGGEVREQALAGLKAIQNKPGRAVAKQ
jgi:hypothetical protein